MSGPKTSADSMLEQALAAIPGLAGVDIVYENTPYKPHGVPYIVINNMHTGSVAGIGGAPTRYAGIFQASVYAPDNKGPGPGSTLVDVVLSGFKPGTKFSNTNSVLYIQQSNPENKVEIPAWLQYPVSVNWFMYQ